MACLSSIFVCSALGNLLGKFGVPYLTFPFNILAITSFLTFKTIYPPLEEPLQPTSALNETQLSPLGIALANGTFVQHEEAEMKGIDWNSVGMGVALSMGQVWAVQDIISSSLINLAVFLHSPLLFAMATIGATVGTLMGVAFLPPDDRWEAYDGIWGFNGVLAMACMSCVFYAFGPLSFTLGLVDCVAVAIAQYALRANMTLQVGL